MSIPGAGAGNTQTCGDVNRFWSFDLAPKIWGS